MSQLPINVSWNLWKASPCSGLVRKSATIASVGQCLISISPLSTQSLTKNNVYLYVLIFLCRSSGCCIPSWLHSGCPVITASSEHLYLAPSGKSWAECGTVDICLLPQVQLQLNSSCSASVWMICNELPLFQRTSNLLCDLSCIYAPHMKHQPTWIELREN